MDDHSWLHQSTISPKRRADEINTPNNPYLTPNAPEGSAAVTPPCKRLRPLEEPKGYLSPSPAGDPFKNILGSNLPSPFNSSLAGSRMSPALSPVQDLSTNFLLPVNQKLGLVFDTSEDVEFHQTGDGRIDGDAYGEPLQGVDTSGNTNKLHMPVILPGTIPEDAVATDGGDISMTGVHTESPETLLDRRASRSDTCLGTLSVLVSSSRDLRDIKKNVPATVTRVGQKTIGVIVEGSYVGTIDSKVGPGLLRVMSMYPSLEFEAFIPKLNLEQNCIRLYVDVYGPRMQIDDIGRSLNKEKLFLQDRPRNTRDLRYENPHILQISEEAEIILHRLEENSMKRVQIKVKNAPVPENEISKIFESETDAFFTKDVSISGRILTKLMQHQEEGVAFMIAKEFPLFVDKTPSLWRTIRRLDGSNCYLNWVDNTLTSENPTTFRGGILADEMGMGKSLTTLALITTSLDTSSSTSRHPTLIVAPKSTLVSWEEQIGRHTREVSKQIYSGKRVDNPYFERFDIVLTTFGIIVSESGNGWISNFPWRRVVLDEAHTIRRRVTKQAKLIYKLDAESRWCLTGTPIQNELDDYGSLLEFLRAVPVNTRPNFTKFILKPLMAGDQAALDRLRQLVAATTLRRTKEKTLASSLPTRLDQVHTLRFDEAESQLYELLTKHTNFLIEQELKSSDGESKRDGRCGRRITQLLLRLRQVCNHGAALLPVTLCDELDLFQNGACSAMSSFATCCEVCGTDDDGKLDCGIEMSDCQHLVCHDCLKKDADTLQDVCPLCSFATQVSPDEMDIESVPSLSSPEPFKLHRRTTLTISDHEIVPPSTKVLALLQNLRDCKAEKSVVFSCWTKMLDLVAKAMDEYNIPFERLDGSMRLAEREQRLENFRTNDTVRVFLATIGSGGVGIDLTVASRIHILEPQFNPMLEEQALARVHRIGQTRPVVTVRYIMENTYEERIQSLQRKKIKLAELCSGAGNKSSRSSVETLKFIKELLR